MDVEIYSVKSVGKGQLSIMPCPKAMHLEHNLAQLRELGVDSIVSLLEVTEAERLGVGDEALLCSRLGISFRQFSIRDHKTPTDTLAFRELINTLEQELHEGHHIAVHCLAGIGRTGLVAGALLIQDGLAAAVATELLSSVRGCVVPQTHDQSNYLIDYQTGDEVRFTPQLKQRNWFMRWWSPAAR